MSLKPVFHINEMDRDDLLRQIKTKLQNTPKKDMDIEAVKAENRSLKQQLDELRSRLG